MFCRYCSQETVVDIDPRVLNFCGDTSVVFIEPVVGRVETRPAIQIKLCTNCGRLFVDKDDCKRVSDYVEETKKKRSKPKKR